MIVRPMKDSVRLIPQHDHARAAGSLLRHWVGLDSVPALNSELAVAVWFAVDNHDVGWCKTDEKPSYDPRRAAAARLRMSLNTWGNLFVSSQTARNC
jgi:hypothetical protein